MYALSVLYVCKQRMPYQYFMYASSEDLISTSCMQAVKSLSVLYVCLISTLCMQAVKALSVLYVCLISTFGMQAVKALSVLYVCVLSSVVPRVRHCSITAILQPMSLKNAPSSGLRAHFKICLFFRCLLPFLYIV